LSEKRDVLEPLFMGLVLDVEGVWLWSYGQNKGTTGQSQTHTQRKKKEKMKWVYRVAHF